VLNTPPEKRFKNLDEDLAAFPYVNGKLFEEILPNASFDRQMRQALLNCCYIDWSKISPAIFGSMFQSVMNPKERRNLGAHYTSEANILKLIKPLFLDELWDEFHNVKSNRNKLAEFQKKLSTLQFLDPACGCGNFLIITYRELRLLEFEILKALNPDGQRYFDISQIVWLDVDQFHGIEYEEFPARIAEVAMWLIDHQMNMLISNAFGQYFLRLPLKKAAHIVHGNALRVDWETVVSKDDLSYIIGNPPFLGSAYQNSEQKKDMEGIFPASVNFKMLDYVSAWYAKASQLIHKTKISAAFVSTNSITQGEQVGILWNYLFRVYNIKINFAHQTFSWNNEARGNAAVHVVIIGFSHQQNINKLIFEYENIRGLPHAKRVNNINPYLFEGKDFALTPRAHTICDVPQMQSGSASRDGGYLILTDEDKNELENANPNSTVFLRRFVSGEDFINNVKRWCIWLKNIDPDNFRDIPQFQERFRKVKEFREKSTRNGTRKMAGLPFLFAEERQPEVDFLLIPKVSSENRKYIPIAYLSNDYIVTDKTFIVPNTSNYHFGVLTSMMHMAWVKNTCGRLKSDFSYSNSIVYNNFPWPENPTEKQVKAIEAAAQAVLDARAQFPNSSLADLYDPLTMPAVLVKAHNELDKAVDQAYRPTPFQSEAQRMEFLFALYEKYTADLFTKEKGKGRKR
jgi:hypothetical protein